MGFLDRLENKIFKASGREDGPRPAGAAVAGAGIITTVSVIVIGFIAGAAGVDEQMIMAIIGLMIAAGTVFAVYRAWVPVRSMPTAGMRVAKAAYLLALLIITAWGTVWVLAGILMLLALIIMGFVFVVFG